MEKNKVLIVDDISENIETISEMIKDFDIDVKTANGGKEAIELIDSFKPDVILLDLMMPDVTGWDVHAWNSVLSVPGSKPPTIPTSGLQRFCIVSTALFFPI